VSSSTKPAQRRPVAPVALVVDIACVLLFCAVGRRSHAEGVTVSGVAQTAWPFLTGTVLGWLLCRGWRRPTALLPTGVTVWVSTVVVGMVLRKVASQGVVASFVVVASVVTAALLLGWRGLAGRRCGARHEPR
jgi:peptidoglycan/LPS O-acetylase OafA/YrhL